MRRPREGGLRSLQLGRGSTRVGNRRKPVCVKICENRTALCRPKCFTLVLWTRLIFHFRGFGFGFGVLVGLGVGLVGFCFVLSFLDIGSHCVIQTGLELTFVAQVGPKLLLPQPPEGWGYSLAPPCPADCPFDRVVKCHRAEWGDSVKLCSQSLKGIELLRGERWGPARPSLCKEPAHPRGLLQLSSCSVPSPAPESRGTSWPSHWWHHRENRETGRTVEKHWREDTGLERRRCQAGGKVQGHLCPPS